MPIIAPKKDKAVIARYAIISISLTFFISSVIYLLQRYNYRLAISVIIKRICYGFFKKRNPFMEKHNNRY